MAEQLNIQTDEVDIMTVPEGCFSVNRVDFLSRDHT